MNHWRRHTAPHSVWAGKTTRERLGAFLHRHADDVSTAIIGGFVFACLFYATVGN